MIRYNVLYGMLVRGADSLGAHDKRYTQVGTTAVAVRLLDIIQPADTARRALFASTLCAFVLDTQFGNEIAVLDPNNTYIPPERSDELVATAAECMYDMTDRPSSLRAALPYLDADIAERLVAPQWIDYAAAICLQLLREAF